MNTHLQDSCVTRKALRVITCDAVIADSAYLVYAAMKRAEIDCPDLIKIPLWNSFKACAWVWFFCAFEELA